MEPTSIEATDQALARAVIFQTLSLAFQPPTNARLRQMEATTGFGTLRLALEQQGTARFKRLADRLQKISRPKVEAVAMRFVQLFGHTARGLVCACETEYGPANGFHQPQQLADLAGYYHAFGLQPLVAADVRLDHVACECEFMDFLNRKEAVLIAEGPLSADSEEMLAVTRRAQRGFLRNHLARFGCAFATSLAEEDRGGFFGTLGEVLLAVLQSECARLNIEPGPSDLAVRPECDDEVPTACGDDKSELIQIQRSR
jgi:TorA maturation chaperone TorD